MEFEEILKLLAEVSNAVEAQEIEWENTGKTRYETNWEEQEIIIDRRNNIDKNSQELYVKIGDFEKMYLPSSDEFEQLTSFMDSI